MARFRRMSPISTIRPLRLTMLGFMRGVGAAVSGGGVPVNSVLPVVSPANFYAGNVLTCSTGTWSNNPTSYLYQWMKNGVVIDSAASNTYTAVVGDITATLTCVVQGNNATGGGVAVTSTGQRCLWSPVIWGATAYCYLDTTEAAGVTEAVGTITQLNDLSGSAHPQSQATQSAQPVKRTSAFFNGLNVAYFNGVQTTGPFMTGPSEATGGTAIDFSFVVFKMNMATATPSCRVASHAPPSGAGETSANGIIIAAQTSSTASFRATFGGLTAPSYNYDGSRAVMWAMQQLSTGGQTSGDGNTFIAETTPTARTINAGRAGLSVNINSTTLGGQRAEMEFAIWVRVRGFQPTQSDVDKLFGWAAFKLGLQAFLPAGHTYKSSPP